MQVSEVSDLLIRSYAPCYFLRQKSHNMLKFLLGLDELIENLRNVFSRSAMRIKIQSMLSTKLIVTGALSYGDGRYAWSPSGHHKPQVKMHFAGFWWSCVPGAIKLLQCVLILQISEDVEKWIIKGCSAFERTLHIKYPWSACGYNNGSYGPDSSYRA